jgi:nicotinamidase-related amidase
MSGQALLVMDVQVGFMNHYGGDADKLLETLQQAIAAARSASVPVIYVRVGFRPGVPEMSRRNRMYKHAAASLEMGVDDAGTQIHPAIAPQTHDIVVVKKRSSAFAGSDLEVVLRSLDVTALVLAGYATSGVVLSTLRQAADLDFQVTVLRDGCADGNREVHDFLLDKVFSQQAAVCAVADWAGGLTAQTP